MTRICKKCDIEKSLEDFLVHHRLEDGTVYYRYTCRVCGNVCARENYYKSDLYKARQKKKAERERKYAGLTRVCKRCGLEKNASEFPENKKTRHCCFACYAKQQREWGHKHKKKKSIIAKRAYVKTDRFLHALKQSDASARRNSYTPCSATVEEIRIAFTGKCQNSGCQIPEAECHKRLALEHDHKTGEFRGWLCHQCNIALGLLRDDVEHVRGLAQYIEQSQGVV